MNKNIIKEFLNYGLFRIFRTRNLKSIIKDLPSPTKKGKKKRKTLACIINAKQLADMQLLIYKKNLYADSIFINRGIKFYYYLQNFDITETSKKNFFMRKCNAKVNNNK